MIRDIETEAHFYFVREVAPTAAVRVEMENRISEWEDDIERAQEDLSPATRGILADAVSL